MKTIEKITKALHKALKELNCLHEQKWIEEWLQKKENEGVQGEELFEICQNLLKRRKKGEPLAYIFGDWDYRDLNLFVGPGVLIPRPETEELVDVALDPAHFSSYFSSLKILDLGAGTGAIGLGVLGALKKVGRLNDKVELFAVENSEEAFPYLEKNFDKYRQEFRPAGMTALKVDWNQINIPEFKDKFDMLVSNPPYVAEEEWDSLDPGVKNFEPRSALVPHGSRGDPKALTAYMEILEVAATILKSGALGFFEMGNQADALLQAMARDASFRSPRIHFDMAGKKRFVSFRRK